MKERDWNKWAKELHARQDAEEDADLAAAKETAHKLGKERFDLDVFDTLYDPVPEEGRDDQRRSLEIQYYLDFPDLMTMKAFAKLLYELEVWKDAR